MAVTISPTTKHVESLEVQDRPDLPCNCNVRFRWRSFCPDSRPHDWSKAGVAAVHMSLPSFGGDVERQTRSFHSQCLATGDLPYEVASSHTLRLSSGVSTPHDIGSMCSLLV